MFTSAALPAKTVYYASSEVLSGLERLRDNGIASEGGSKDLETLKDGQIAILEPYVVYHLHGGYDRSVECIDDICSTTKYLTWLGKGVITMNLVCYDVPDTICQTSGVAMRAGHDEKSICFDNQIVFSSLETNETAEFQVWWRQGTGVLNISEFFLASIAFTFVKRKTG